MLRFFFSFFFRGFSLKSFSGFLKCSQILLVFSLLCLLHYFQFNDLELHLPSSLVPSLTPALCFFFSSLILFLDWLFLSFFSFLLWLWELYFPFLFFQHLTWNLHPMFLIFQSIKFVGIFILLPKQKDTRIF